MCAGQAVYGGRRSTCYIKQAELQVKTRTYRRVARKRYLAVAKKRRKTKRVIRKAIGQQLRYLRRNLSTIEQLLDLFDNESIPWEFRDFRIYWVIQVIYDQQKYMYENKVKRCDDRIVNIYQPYVRPIKRGKDKADVEFGAKLGVSEWDGFSRLNHISWDAYNESGDLVGQVEGYRDWHGYYPEVILVDQIYLTRANRKYLKEKGIRHVGPKLGRPAEESPYERRKRRKERNMRNHVEGKFGQSLPRTRSVGGKNAYGLDEIRARRQDTSESWLGGIFLAMNITRVMKIFSILLILATLVVDLFFAFASAACYPRRGLERAMPAIKAKSQAVNKFWDVFFPKRIYVFG